MAKGSCPFSRIGTNGTMHSGMVACSSRGAERGLVMSAITKRDRLVSKCTVSGEILV